MTNGTGKSNLRELAEFFDIRNTTTGLLIHAIIATAIFGYFLMEFFDSPNPENQVIMGLAIGFVLFASYLLAVKYFYNWILPSRSDAT